MPAASTTSTPTMSSLWFPEVKSKETEYIPEVMATLLLLFKYFVPDMLRAVIPPGSVGFFVKPLNLLLQVSVNRVVAPEASTSPTLFIPIGVSRPAKSLSLASTAPRVFPTSAGVPPVLVFTLYIIGTMLVIAWSLLAVMSSSVRR